MRVSSEVLPMWVAASSDVSLFIRRAGVCLRFSFGRSRKRLRRHAGTTTADGAVRALMRGLLQNPVPSDLALCVQSASRNIWASVRRLVQSKSGHASVLALRLLACRYSVMDGARDPLEGGLQREIGRVLIWHRLVRATDESDSIPGAARDALLRAAAYPHPGGASPESGTTGSASRRSSSDAVRERNSFPFAERNFRVRFRSVSFHSQDFIPFSPLFLFHGVGPL